MIFLKKQRLNQIPEFCPAREQPFRDHRKSEIFWELHCKCNSKLFVSAELRLCSALSVSAELRLCNTLSVSAELRLCSTLSVSAELRLCNTLSVSAELRLCSALSVSLRSSRLLNELRSELSSSRLNYNISAPYNVIRCIVSFLSRSTQESGLSRKD
ncbi:predicted protein [Methanosarcina acetivorans C2A]|uniref:Uncharacterized protein n=1 Tax=Methanosarcina acetivorans (strain ATCC 35395 / DSM 2834 / JCM 12185 / C2A) TaxID=188937 RepID=Q8TTW3_METAC|nr:predicted protein [Methanosarcina acetivorans C2A]